MIPCFSNPRHPTSQNPEKTHSLTNFYVLIKTSSKVASSVLKVINN